MDSIFFFIGGGAMRLTIVLNKVEMAALERLADSELRGLSQQASKIVIDELTRLGLIKEVIDETS
jgi:hypothetical protein